MLGYIRILTFFQIFITALATVCAAMWFNIQASSSVLALGEQANLAEAQYFSAALWANYHDALAQGALPPSFQDDVKRFVQGTGVAGVRVYTPQGALAYTSGGTRNMADFNRDASAVRIRPGSAVSAFTSAGAENLTLPAGPSSPVVGSFLAFGPTGADGFVEFFTDVTVPSLRLKLLKWEICGIIILLSLLSLLGTYRLYWKADYMIATQHEENMELEAVAISAEEAAQNKTQFLANISHELRTPLNAIIGFSNLLKDEMLSEVKNPKFAGYINDINSSGVHLLSLINDILDFSKADAGKLELEVGEINATKTVATSIRLVLPRAEAASVNLINEMPKEHFVIETDGKKFKQILLNLLSNSVKFTPAGGSVRVRGWHDLAEDIYVFEVSDTGIGMQQKDIAKAMTPFGQVDNALSRKYEGTGLGLPLTRKFIELMGGKFGISSEANKGTTITFSLPRVFTAADGVVVKKAE